FILVIAFGITLYQNLITKDDANNIDINQDAPNFKLSTLTGEKLEFKDLRGKAVLLNFWASWCEPCKREMPAIEKAYSKYKNDGFEVLGVNMGESEKTVSSFMKNSNLSFQTVLDKTGE